ncbi:MAG: hypothetical protein OEW62_09760 [Candidatus Bathyarchaeota archaeon]|nr:hypothetical protein [Candidatus Bathyarchaeota archaeon]
MRQTTLKGRAIFEGRCEAQALVSTKPISFLGGVDPTNGKIVEKTMIYMANTRARFVLHAMLRRELETAPRK